MTTIITVKGPRHDLTLTVTEDEGESAVKALREWWDEEIIGPEAANWIDEHDRGAA